MNARLYDPVLGRFAGMDPYVQMPDYTQNYNRYAYALNNPLIYTDPDGEMIISLFSEVTLFTSFFKGFKGIKGGKDRTNHPAKSMWNAFKNEAKIIGGLFTTDKNKSAGGKFWEFVSRFTWQFPQTWAGYQYSQTRNSLGVVDRVDYLGGATFLTRENSNKRSGITLANYINIKLGPYEIDEEKFENYVIKWPFIMHEYGHYLDSQKFGLMYIPVIGTVSVLGRIGTDHQIEEWKGEAVYNEWYLKRNQVLWSELRANENARKYFEKRYKERGFMWDWENDTNFHHYPTKNPFKK